MNARWWAAIHEIGHFLVGVHEGELPDPTGVVSLRDDDGGFCQFLFMPPESEDDFIGRFSVYYGGMTAGALAGDPDPYDGADGDLARITDLAQRAKEAGFDARALEDSAIERAKEALRDNQLLPLLARELFVRNRVSVPTLATLARRHLASIASP